MSISVQLIKYNLEQLTEPQRLAIIQAAKDRLETLMGLLPKEVVAALDGNGIAACQVYLGSHLSIAQIGMKQIPNIRPDINKRALQGSAATIFEQINDDNVAADLLRTIRACVDDAFTDILGPVPPKSSLGR